APAPARLIEGGLPTEATVAQVLVSKYADHLPLYRQAQIYARQGINLDRSTLADCVGRAAWHLRPVHERLLEKLKASPMLCIGNAIVDIIAQCDEAFLETNGIIKGAMNLIDTRRAELLYSRMGPAIEASGGSAGNTAAGVASFGGSAAFFGKVSNDALGEIYTHDIHAQGVAFDTRPLKGEPPTARSMIFVTPDGERSMNTYLGACVELGPEDVEADKAAGARVTYFEGYLWDPPRAKEAIRQTAKLAPPAAKCL
ncbi:hypothetical protein ABID26_007255, partial [Mesorhizobium shonense]